MLEILADRVALLRERLATLQTDIIPLAVEFNSFKLKVVLADGSTLHIREQYVRGIRGRYSYYWLDPANNLIIGWDNAGHHSGLPNFPHHKHVGTQTNREPSYETTLEQVLTFIKDRLTLTPSE